MQKDDMPVRKMLPEMRPSLVRRFHITYPERDDTAPIPRLTAALQEIAAMECGIEVCKCAIHRARQALDDEAQAADKIAIKDLKFYIQPGMYDDGTIGELFIKGDQPGSFLAGTMDTAAMLISLALQYGVPLKAITDKLKGNKFGPSQERIKGDADGIVKCTSMFDYIARYLEVAFPNGKWVPKEQRHAVVSEQGEVPK